MAQKIVSGHVIGTDGQAVAGANVMFAEGPVALPDIAQVTDTQGAFSLAAPVSGTYRLVVNAPEHRTWERAVRVGRKNETVVEVVLELGS
jgi:Carboxypeptidase regulatory-like domain